MMCKSRADWLILVTGGLFYFADFLLACAAFAPVVQYGRQWHLCKKTAMKQFLSLIVLLVAAGGASAQKKVQTLQPVRLSIFKNGTFFVKKEAAVSVADQTFYIPAPKEVLMGTYWLGVDKDAGLHSIVIKTDTFRKEQTARSIHDFLQANTGKDITLYRHIETGTAPKISGKLLYYDAVNKWMRLRTEDKKLLIVSAGDFDELALEADAGGTFMTDSLTEIAKVTLSKPVSSTSASTISLQKGIQWFPSYQLRIVNDKEARLEMKATLVNNSDDYLNTPVDIIIGNPEMFFGDQVDPACIAYLSGQLTARSISAFNQNVTYNAVQNGRVVKVYDNFDFGSEDKTGEQFEDLYFYKLGVLNLEKDARVIVPVLTTTVGYKDVYAADLDISSTSANEKNPLEAWHSYRITNSTTAPFTAGAVLVMNAAEQPLAQSLLQYTPVKGNNEIRLSRALNIQLKNEEEEVKREKSNISNTGNSFFDKVTYKGAINIINYHDKKITIRISKTIGGVSVKLGDGGKAKVTRDADDEDETISNLQWEVEVDARGKKQLSYDYFTYKSPS
jgi:hypothetical protein